MIIDMTDSTTEDTVNRVLVADMWRGSWGPSEPAFFVDNSFQDQTLVEGAVLHVDI